MPRHVENSLRSTFSHNTYKVLLVLYDLWQERHLTDGTCICSIRDILKRLGLSFGRENTKMVERELLALRETYISWEFSFMDESGKGKRLLSKNILSKLDYQNIVSSEDQFSSHVEFQLYENIQRNLEINKTRPYQLGELLAISGEIASVL